MSAREMFEKYRFNCIDLRKEFGKIDIRYYKENKDNENQVLIEFYNERYVRITTRYADMQFDLTKTYLEPGIIKAIYKQIEELGWLDE